MSKIKDFKGAPSVLKNTPLNLEMFAKCKRFMERSWRSHLVNRIGSTDARDIKDLRHNILWGKISECLQVMHIKGETEITPKVLYMIEGGVDFEIFGSKHIGDGGSDLNFAGLNIQVKSTSLKGSRILVEYDNIVAVERKPAKDGPYVYTGYAIWTKDVGVENDGRPIEEIKYKFLGAVPHDEFRTGPVVRAGWKNGKRVCIPGTSTVLRKDSIVWGQWEIPGSMKKIRITDLSEALVLIRTGAKIK